MSVEGGDPVNGEKLRIRREIRERLRLVSGPAWKVAADQVASLIGRHPAWMRAEIVGGYVPLSDELDLSGLLRQALEEGRRVAVPSFDPVSGSYLYREIRDWATDLRPGRYGIGEPGVECPPLPVTSLDFALVPGIAFDGLGGRLGRGKGFYDRLLSQAVGVTCGLGLDEQFLACVPVEAHDIRMNLIAVPAGLHEARAMD
jgi:5-formyltetrahydrofolate cyclo-ligase